MINVRLAGFVVMVAATMAGCSFTGVNSIPLPFSKGSSSEDVQATVYLENATNLVPNSEVKFNDLTVGSIRRIEFDDWHAKLSISVDRDARIPADVSAAVAQKSLLGAEYLHLTSGNSRPSARLADGDVIGLDRTGRYPETEEVLAAASLLMNGGGLGQVQTINRELNNALGGREADVRSLVKELRRFTASLDEQRDNIVAMLDHLDRMSREINEEDAVVERALTELPRGVDALADERKVLVAALKSVSGLSDVAHRVVEQSGNDLHANLKALSAITGGIAAAGDSLGKGLGAISFPFPIAAIDPTFRGDFLNFIAIFDVSLEDIQTFYLAGTPLDTLFSGMTNTLPNGTVDDIGNPLLEGLPNDSRNPAAPLNDILGKVGDAVSGVAPKPVPDSAPGSPAPAEPSKSPPNLLERLLDGL